MHHKLYTRPQTVNYSGMKKSFSILIALCLCWSAMTAHAENKPAPARTAPGTQIAQQISLLTGVAITPLLGTSGFGLYKYYKSPANQRANLPWFAQPWFFIPALLLVAVCLIKDTAGSALPTAVKKPFDIAEAVEHKISGLVATGAFVPFLMMMMKDSGAPEAMLSSMGFAAVDMSGFYHALMVPVAMVAFFVVFLASNAINVLIILSPFTTVDAALKGVRLALLGTVAASALANPWVGAAWALIIILLSYLIAGWSFRLSHYGLVYVWDFFTFRSSRFTPDKVANKMFLGRKTNKVPARTYGKLSRDEKGHLMLTYRPWLFLAARTLVLPAGQYAVGKGLINSELVKVEGEDTRTAMLLPPRYRSHEEQLVSIYSLADVRPIGLRAAMKWLKQFFGGKEQTVVA